MSHKILSTIGYSSKFCIFNNLTSADEICSVLKIYYYCYKKSLRLLRFICFLTAWNSFPIFYLKKKMKFKFSGSAHSESSMNL